jgi:hypothetical protein
MYRSDKKKSFDCYRIQVSIPLPNAGTGSIHIKNLPRQRILHALFMKQWGSLNIYQYKLCSGSGSGIWCLFDPWIWDPGWEKNQDPDLGSRSWINNQGSYFRELKNQFFYAYPGPGMEQIRIRDSGWKKVGSGINIPDPQHCTYISLACDATCWLPSAASTRRACMVASSSAREFWTFF